MTRALMFGTTDVARIDAIDGRVRVLACLAFLLVLPAVDGAAPLGLAAVIGAGAVAAAGLRSAVILRRLAMAEGFVIALMLTLPFAVQGQPVVTLFGLVASWEGLAQAAKLAVRINAGVLVTMALLGGIGSEGLARALTGLGLPPRLGQILQMTVRYIALFEAEYHRLRLAMRTRGFQVGSNRHSWRSLGYLIGMILLRSFERAATVHGAMLCRGYKGEVYDNEPHTLTRYDAGFAGLAICLMIAIGVLEFAT